ncbi:MAG: WD40/YVTN/BNR-like repeat-containing protein [Vicinamibacterales bacterium]
MWESIDGGTSWLPITDAAPTLATGAIAFAPSDPQIIYVGTGEAPGGVGFVQVGVGMLKSTDGGRACVASGFDICARVGTPDSRASGPANFAATKAGNTISLTWDLPIAGPAPTSFIVNVTGAFMGAFPLTARRISGAVGPGSYTMTVTSVNSCGTSVASSPVTVVVP